VCKTNKIPCNACRSGSAILQVLGPGESDLRVKEIWHKVERLLGDPVSRHSVTSYAHRGTYDLKIFEQRSHGRYRLAPPE
jgi:hypothetical protein